MTASDVPSCVVRGPASHLRPSPLLLGCSPGDGCPASPDGDCMPHLWGSTCAPVSQTAQTADLSDLLRRQARCSCAAPCARCRTGRFRADRAQFLGGQIPGPSESAPSAVCDALLGSLSMDASQPADPPAFSQVASEVRESHVVRCHGPGISGGDRVVVGGRRPRATHPLERRPSLRADAFWHRAAQRRDEAPFRREHQDAVRLEREQRVG